MEIRIYIYIKQKFIPSKPIALTLPPLNKSRMKPPVTLMHLLEVLNYLLIITMLFFNVRLCEKSKIISFA
jgi:hypothetical protein